MKKIEAVFKNKETCFIPYVTAGDPDLKTTYEVIKTLEKAGADIIELGVPFTDPVADGPTIQKAAERALENGCTLQDILTLVKRLRDEGCEVPILLMGYINLVFSYGYDAFCKDAVAHGINATLWVDLPPEESEEYLEAAEKHGLATVYLCSPTTTDERLKLVNECATGFVYYVARAGVTGVQNELDPAITEKLSALRSVITKPLCVGFGISKPDQAVTLAPHTDGIIVGSAIVKLFEDYGDDALLDLIESFTRSMVEAI